MFDQTPKASPTFGMSATGGGLPLEAVVEAENAALSDVMVLLSGAVPLDRWKPALLGALAGALRPDGGANRREATKASRLASHLFGDMPSPLDRVDPVLDRVADRLRADLSGLVAFGAGLHLVDYDGIAASWTRTPR